MKTPIDDTCKDYPIRPEHINTSGHFWSAFEHSETEISANYVVQLCQRNGGWKPFSFTDINNLYKSNKNAEVLDYSFNNLRCFKYLREGMPVAEAEGCQYIQAGADGLMRVTHEFITACFRSSPSGAFLRACNPPSEDEHSASSGDCD
jgi:hypothetical protein